MTAILFLAGCQIVYWYPYPLIGGKVVGSWISIDGYYKLTFNYENKFFLKQWTSTDTYCPNSIRYVHHHKCKCKNKLYFKRYNKICLDGFYELKSDSLHLKDAVFKATEKFSYFVYGAEFLEINGNSDILSNNYPVLIGTWSRENIVLPKKNPGITRIN